MDGHIPQNGEYRRNINVQQIKTWPKHSTPLPRRGKEEGLLNHEPENSCVGR